MPLPLPLLLHVPFCCHPIGICLCLCLCRCLFSCPTQKTCHPERSCSQHFASNAVEGSPYLPLPLLLHVTFCCHPVGICFCLCRCLFSCPHPKHMSSERSCSQHFAGNAVEGSPYLPLLLLLHVPFCCHPVGICFRLCRLHLSFPPKKNAVKPPKRKYPRQSSTFAWRMSYALPAILDIESQKPRIIPWLFSLREEETPVTPLPGRIWTQPL
jgi:hypothetical protein